MICLGLDVATNTGWGLVSATSFDDIEMRCGSWKCDEWSVPKDAPYSAKARPARNFAERSMILGDHIAELLRRQIKLGLPVDRAGIEAPLGSGGEEVSLADGSKRFIQRSNPNTMQMLPGMAGGGAVAAHLFRIPVVEVIAPGTWRKTVLGMGRPPRNADKGFLKKEMEKLAATLALKFNFDVPNTDAAEGLGIALHLAIEARLFSRADIAGASLFKQQQKFVSAADAFRSR